MQRQLGASPSRAEDAVTKGYVDDLIAGIEGGGSTLVNLMTANPSFDEDIAGWNQEDAYWFHNDTEGHSAPGCAQTTGDGTYHWFAGEAVPIEIGKTYLVACWVKQEDVTFHYGGFNIGINRFTDSYDYIDFANLDGHNVVETDGSWSTRGADGSSDWTLAFGQYTAVDDGSGVGKISITLGLQAESGDVFVDDCIIAEIPLGQGQVAGLGKTLDRIYSILYSPGSVETLSVLDVSSGDPVTITSASSGTSFYVVGSAGAAVEVTVEDTFLQYGSFTIFNRSDRWLDVKSSDDSSILSMVPGTQSKFVAINPSPSTPADWLSQYSGIVSVGGKAIFATATLILSGTDSTVMTFPSSSDSIVGVNATQSLYNKTLISPKKGVVSNGTVTTSCTLDLTNGTLQTVTLTASTACTFTMPTPVAGKEFTLYVHQAPSTGSGTATFTGAKWPAAGAPTITAAAGKMDILLFSSDGTNWYGSYTQGYTP